MFLKLEALSTVTLKSKTRGDQYHNTLISYTSDSSKVDHNPEYNINIAKLWEHGRDHT